MNRPDFDTIKDFEEFSKYYWYREELIKICKAHGLKHTGSKIELNKVIEAYFAGEKILPERTPGAGKRCTPGDGNRCRSGAGKKNHGDSGSNPRKKKITVTDLTPETGLIECGFTFGNRFREFFSEQTGEEHFKFNVDMVATVKEVKAKGDESFTLGDLLDIYYGRKTYAKYDKSALQWNRFVKDFCADEATAGYKERLKAAAALWKIVRESDREKVYSRELLEEFGSFVDCDCSGNI